MTSFFEQRGIEEFDIEVAIANFLADETSSSLELPHMTTGQRKQTKKAVDRHPGLTCESYGFGQERQLHLFKKSQDTRTAGKTIPEPIAVGKAAMSMSIQSPFPVRSSNTINAKNATIDGCFTSEGNNTESKPVVSRSVPPMLSESVMGCSAAEDDNRLDSYLVGNVASKAEQQVDATCTDCSTDASSSSSSHGDSSPTSSMGGMPRKPPGLPTPTNVQIRNTFVHFETPHKDDRAVQSMPHGMFGQCFWAEVLSERVAEQALLSPSANESAPTLTPFGVTVEAALFTPGTHVKITGLVKLPAFNGMRGTVESLDENTGRYNILFLAPVDGHTKAKVKHENLRPISCTSF